MSRIFVSGVGFDAVSEREAVAHVSDFLAGRVSVAQKSRQAWGSSRGQKKFLLVTPNPEMLLTAQKNSAFKKVLNAANLAVADGVGILWATYFLNLKRRNFFTLIASLLAILFARKKIRTVLPARVTGSDLFPKLLRLAEQKKQKVFLLGAAPGVAEAVKTKFEKKFPNLEIADVFAGSPQVSEELEICEKINASGAKMLFVAFGAPAQELWISRNLPKLKTTCFAAGIGGTFDFYAGRVVRAPSFFRSFGLEWLWRLLCEPRRLGRIWNATVCFVTLVWRGR